MLPPEAFWPCLHPIEQGVIVDVWFADNVRSYWMTGAQWDLIWLGQGIGWLDHRKLIFEGLYGVTITTHALPPPLDVQVTWDSTIWAPIYDYGDATNFPVDRRDCDILAFKGNQGGAWPVLWP